jgi:hypothetical protein
VSRSRGRAGRRAAAGAEKPSRYTFPACCAPPASGAARAPASEVSRKWRRSMPRWWGGSWKRSTGRRIRSRPGGGRPVVERYPAPHESVDRGIRGLPAPRPGGPRLHLPLGGRRALHHPSGGGAALQAQPEKLAAIDFFSSLVGDELFRSGRLSLKTLTPRIPALTVALMVCAVSARGLPTPDAPFGGPNGRRIGVSQRRSGRRNA